MSSDFINGLIERAKQRPCRICLPESASADVLRLAEAIVASGVGTPVLVGNRITVEQIAAENDIATTGFEYFDNTDEVIADEFATKFVSKFDLFTHKACLRRIKDNLLCSMLLLKAGNVDCTAAGKECPTGEVIMGAMGIVGLKEGVTAPSSLGIADIPGFNGPQGTMLALGDCAITAQPDAETLAGIAISSADTVRSLMGWEPRVALLAFSTKGSARHETIDVICNAVAKVHELRPDIKCDGELQLDAAIIPAVAAHKVKDESEVAGKANVLIFPNLHAGNIGVKMVQIFGHANAYGPVLQGFSKPVCDFSRSAPTEEMLGNVSMLVIRAAAQGRE